MMRSFLCILFIFTGFSRIFEVEIVLAADTAFSIDTNLTTSGWHTNEEKKQVTTDCSDTLVSTEGSITSPGFDEALPPGFHCDWLVILPEGSSVRLNFSSFDLPLAASGHCKDGFLLLGTFSSNGNRKSELGPVCGTEAPREISLPWDKFWVSLYWGISGTRQGLHDYKGFSLSFSQVLQTDHEPDSSSDIEPGWYSLIVIAGPLLFVVPLYLCLRRRRSIPLYCSDQDTSETVVRRFRKKHRPYYNPDIQRSGIINRTVCRSITDVNDVTNITKHSYYGGSGDYENVKKHRRHRDDFHYFKNMYVSRSSFPSTDGSLDSPVFLEKSGNTTQTHLPMNTTGKYLTLPVQSTRKSRTSYLSILPDFESTLDHGKIQSKESLNLKSPQSPSLACVDQVSGKRSVYQVSGRRSVYFQDQLIRKRPMIQGQPTHKRPVSQDQMTHNRPVSRDQMTHNRPVSRDQMTHKRPVSQDQMTHKHPVIPIITITSASLRRKQRLSTVRKSEDSNSPLMDVNTGQRFRGSFKPPNHVKAWQSVDDVSDESDCFSEPVMNSSQTTEFHTAKSSQDQHFGFSSASILQYRESSENELKSSVSNESTPRYHQTGNSESSAVDAGAPRQTEASAEIEYISETKYPEYGVRKKFTKFCET